MPELPGLPPNPTPDDIATAVLVAHQRRDISGCICGWAKLGASHPAHQVAMLRSAGLSIGRADETKCDAHKQAYFMSGYEAGKRDALDPSLQPGDGRPTPSQPDALLRFVDGSASAWLVPAWLGPFERADGDETRSLSDFTLPPDGAIVRLKATH